MKRIVALKLLALMAVLLACVLLTFLGCGNSEETSPSSQVECQHSGGRATCTKKAVCTLCGEEYGRRKSHDTEKEIVSATCETEGYTIEACLKCDYTKKYDFVSLGGHDMCYAGSTVANCVESGYSIYRCSVCGHEERDIDCGPTGEHRYEVIEYIEETCEIDGLIVEICRYCGDEQREASPSSGHAFAITEVEAATCQEFEKVTKVCARCGDTRVVLGTQKASHKHVVTVTLEPTCTTEGERSYICQVCGGVGYKVGLERVIPALGHTYEREGNAFSSEAGVTFIPADCEDDGYFERVCQDCGYDRDPITREEYSELEGTADFDAVKYDEMEKWGHKFTVYVGEVDATCTENGYEKIKCERCDAIERETTSYAYGHTYYKGADAKEGVHYVIIEEPTASSEGWKAYVCTVCSEVATCGEGVEVIPPLSKE